MNTLLTHRDKKKLFSYLPDVWFLAILLLGWGGLMSTMLFGAWHMVGVHGVLVLYPATIQILDSRLCVAQQTIGTQHSGVPRA